jgi:hypothetical protein
MSLSPCTPCRGKPDQLDTYTSHASPRTPSVCFLRAVPVRGNLSRGADRFGQKKGSRHNPQQADWPIRGSVPSFSPEPDNEAWGVSQAPDDDQLLGLPGSYHRHAIGTFNTCSWRPTEQSLIDTGGGYKPWRCRLTTYPLPDLPIQLSPLSPSGPARSPF